MSVDSSELEEHNAGKPVEHEHHEYIVFLFLCLSIFLGVATQRILWLVHNRWPHLPVLPYTVTLFLEGMCLFSIHYLSDMSLGPLSKSIEMWVHIDPHTLLYIFLPALIFGDVIFLNCTAFRAALTQCLLLAGPGVIIGTVLTAVVVKLALETYNFTWVESLALGALLGATDPVAVLSILKEIGAPPGLRMKITGEALLNDGVAIVLWSFFVKILEGESFSAGDSIFFFLRLVVGAVLLGMVMGVLLIQGLSSLSDRLVEGNAIGQIALTITVAYASFSIAEGLMHVSGVLALCISALIVARWGMPLLVHVESVHHVWEALEFFGNTLVFLLAGLIYGERVVWSTLSDMLMLLVLWILSLVIRFLMVFFLFPLLRITGPGITWKEALIIVWSGLRGAVGIAMVLAMRFAVEDAKWKKMVFLTAGIAKLTLIVQATTIKPILKSMGMLKTTENEDRRVARLRSSLKNHVFAIFQFLLLQPTFDGVSEMDVCARVTTIRERDISLKSSMCCMMEKHPKLFLLSILNGWSKAAAEKQKRAKLKSSIFHIKFLPKGDMTNTAIKVLANAKAEGRECFLAKSREPAEKVTMRKTIGEGLFQMAKDRARKLSIPPTRGSKSVIVHSSVVSNSMECTDSTLNFRPRSVSQSPVGIAAGEPIVGQKADFCLAENFKNAKVLRASTHDSFETNRSFDIPVNLRSSLCRRTSLVDQTSLDLWKSDWAQMNNGNPKSPVPQGELEFTLPLYGDKQGPARTRSLIDTIDPTDPYWQDELEAERKLFLSVLKAEYLTMRKEGLLPDGCEAAQILLDSIDYAQDKVQTALEDWAFIEKQMCIGDNMFSNMIKFLLRKASGHVKFAPMHGPDGSFFDCYTFICFIDAHNAAEEVLASRKTFGSISLARRRVLMESAQQLFFGEKWFRSMKMSECTASKVRMKQLALKLLTVEKAKVTSWMKLGMINNLQAEVLLESTIQDLGQLHQERRNFGKNDESIADLDMNVDHPGMSAWR
eukprot:GEMP01006660.1.p1 GENE.GEMP01006660.1~~GEMP01006660.1.p1  ORF type:complete len:999 (+),score=130.70 GEMP01006660.1:12-3008(+)